MQITTCLRRLSLFMFSMVFSLGVIFAQERTVTGKVTADGEGPVPGVNVVVQGTVTGAITDINGAYSIRVPGPSAVLVFSSIGYITQSVTVGALTVIDVVMVSDVQALSEVVVTGYSTQRKRDITGAVGVVSATDLKSIPAANVTQQLQGRTSGVTVIGNGMPGSTTKVRIRGFSSFDNNEPIYIIDGVPGDIAWLNPNDVESMVVLKDAGAASVYGSRASNGVIVITTKKGSKGVQVTYDVRTGVSIPGAGPTPDLLTTEEHAQLQWLIYKNDGTVENHPFLGPSSNANPTIPSWAAHTDWYSEITHNAMTTNHDITLSGGNDNAKYFAGFGLNDADGVLIHNYAKRYSGRFNSEFKILKDRITVGENMTVTYRKSLGTGNLGEGSPFQAGPYRLMSIIPVRWTGADFTGLSHTFIAGDYGGTGIANRLGNVSNTVANQERNKDDWGQNLNLLGNVFVDIKILNGLNFRSTLGGAFYTGYGIDFGPASYENSENTLTPTFNENANWGMNWIWTNTFTYDKVLGDHKITAVAGYEAVKDGMGRNVSATRGGYFSTDVSFRTLTNGATINAATSGLNTPFALVSMFAKADYSFRNKYLLSATIRRDGSSKFGPDVRFGIFPSFSGAWRISEESFFSGLDWISDLKIRGSWGQMGNQLGASTQNQFYLYGGNAGSSNYDLSGAMTSSLQGFRPTRIGNPEAIWETNTTSDLGFEATLLQDRITIVFDLYSKITSDLLFQLEKPGTAGLATAPNVNVAGMKNTGIDAELGFKDNFGDIGINASMEFTTYKNTIEKIAEGITFFDQGGGTTRIGTANRNMVGEPMSAFFGYKVIGIFQDDAEVTSSAVQSGAEPGFLKFQDTDGNGTIEPADRVIIGNPNPKFTYGLNLGVSYKNLDLTGFLYGSYGADIFNWNSWWIDFWPSFLGQKSKRLLYESWTPERTNTDVPKASNKSNFSTTTQVTSFYIEKGSFVRLKNLQLGYTIPGTITNKVNIKSLRVYVQTINLFTLTKYSGMDPELGGDDRAFGSDTGNYPNVKQVVFGLNLVL